MYICIYIYICLCVCVFICLSLCVCVSLSISLSLVFLCLSVTFSLSLSALSVCLVWSGLVWSVFLIKRERETEREIERERERERENKNKKKKSSPWRRRLAGGRALNISLQQRSRVFDHSKAPPAAGGTMIGANLSGTCTGPNEQGDFAGKCSRFQANSENQWGALASKDMPH